MYEFMNMNRRMDKLLPHSVHLRLLIIRISSIISLSIHTTITRELHRKENIVQYNIENNGILGFDWTIFSVREVLIRQLLSFFLEMFHTYRLVFSKLYLTFGLPRYTWFYKRNSHTGQAILTFPEQLISPLLELCLCDSSVESRLVLSMAMRMFPRHMLVNPRWDFLKGC